MNPITIKDSTGTDRLFNVVRQPGGETSGMLLYLPAGVGSRLGAVKIEVSSKIGQGKSNPVVTVTVPYGTVQDGIFQKIGQISRVATGNLPANSPELARLDAEAFARNLMANTQVQALFQNGTLS